MEALSNMLHFQSQDQVSDYEAWDSRLRKSERVEQIGKMVWQNGEV